MAEDDLWTVGSDGGVARRLTAGLGEVTHPSLSPDGEWIAFVGREEGSPEVYVMPAAGGPARRLTYLGAALLQICGWEPGGKRIVIATSAGQPFVKLTKLYAVGIDGGLPELLPFGPARSIAYGPGGRAVVGRTCR